MQEKVRFILEQMWKCNIVDEQLQENELNKPWVTEAMKNEIMKKHKLYQKAKKSNEENEWKEFKEQKARVATMIREAKLEYIGSHPEEVRFIFAV